MACFVAIGIGVVAVTDTDPSPVPTEPAPGDPAIWMPNSESSLTTDSTSVDVLITKPGPCDGGRRPTPLRPGVVFEDTRVVITFTVRPRPPVSGFATCPAVLVPARVELGRPIGDRELVDPWCAGRTLRTGWCAEDLGIRWVPPGREPSIRKAQVRWSRSEPLDERHVRVFWNCQYNDSERFAHADRAGQPGDGGYKIAVYVYVRADGAACRSQERHTDIRVDPGTSHQPIIPAPVETPPPPKSQRGGN